MSWFETWFNTTLYEKVYANRDDQEAALLADFIETLIPPTHYPELLDLACGRGRHSVNMARKGYRVTGVDLAPRAIKAAEERAAAEGVHSVSFYVGDMRTLSGGPYDAVLNLFTSFGYVEEDAENAAVLENVESLLKPGGVFIQDYLNPGFVRTTLIPHEEQTIGEITCQIERKIEGDMVIKTILFPGDRNSEPARFSERVKLYDSDWFQKYLTASGLTLTAVYGDYEGGDYDPQRSPRQLMVSHKAG